MISAASFNYYQEVEREAQDIPDSALREATETGELLSVMRVLREHLLVPWGFLATDQTEL
jgi:hypothetical protein